MNRHERRAAKAQAKRAGNGMETVQVGDYLPVPADLAESYHGLFAELMQEAGALQQPRVGEFDQHSAAVHEASHCVAAAR
jgi:hypothetical protein